MGNSKALLMLPVALMLGGCPDRPKITASPTFVCAELKQYSPAEQNKAADELEKYADEIPMIGAMIDDYGSLRAGIRAVCGRKKSGS